MPGTDVAAVVDRFLEVVRDGDTDGFLHLFIPEGTVDDGGRVFTGSRQIRAWSGEEFIGGVGNPGGGRRPADRGVDSGSTSGDH